MNNVMESIIIEIGKTALLRNLWPIILGLLLVGSNVFWSCKRCSYKKLITEQTKHINVLTIQNKDLSIQKQQEEMKLKACLVEFKQKKSREEIQKIDKDITSLQKQREILSKEAAKEKESLRGKSIDDLKNRLNGEW